MELLTLLRQNSRTVLKTLSKKTKIPLSTLFTRISNRCDGNIVRFVSLIDFEKAGFHGVCHALIRANNTKNNIKNKKKLRKYLSSSSNINSLYEINNGFNFYCEFVFATSCVMYDYFEKLKKKFRCRVIIYPILEEIKKEGCLS